MKIGVLAWGVAFWVACIAVDSAAEAARSGAVDRVNILVKQSDLVARVKVESVEFVLKPAKNEDGQVGYDVSSHGRLISLRSIHVYTSKLEKPPDTLYVFQRGAVRGLGQASLEAGAEYIVFLRACSPPNMVGKNEETVPPLPSKDYYFLVQERGGGVVWNKSESFILLDDILRRRDDKTIRSTISTHE
ncbi:MAG TPA: hypothetical protein PKE12_02625 [Kiritimatiellia bacterium]|nr:hypothetical protein [Kiritimatiellia bacterium]